MIKLFKKVDILKIKGPYPILALFLLLIQGFLGTWFYQAESELERIISGICMTILMGLFLFIVLKIRQTEILSKSISLEGFSGNVTPAKAEATEQEINSPEVEIIASSDATFTINKPPNNWIVKELTLADYMGESLSITDKKVKDEMANSLKIDLLDKVLTLKSKNITYVIPIPGVTIINGRKTLTALEFPIFTRLSILSINRFQPPLYYERSLQYNVYQFIMPVLNTGTANLRKLSTGKLKNGGRNFLTMEIYQELEDAKINGSDGRDVESHITLIGIEGELQDHLLIMNYPTFTKNAELQHDEDIKILKSLVDSFRPLKIIEPENKFQQSKLKADKNFEEVMNTTGKNAFLVEFRILLYRLSDWDMNDPQYRDRAIQQLLSFEIFAKEVDYRDEFFDKFWDSVHQAKEGEALNFKNLIKEILKAVSNAEKSNE